MNSEDSYQVIISGGGPAGLCAALEVAQTGSRVLVVEARDRPPHRDKTRFQAVVLDQQTLINLNNLGVDIERHLQPIHGARFLDERGLFEGSVTYPDIAPTIGGRSSSDLNRIMFRRDIVAMSSINGIEEVLLERCRAVNNVHIRFGSTISGIRTGSAELSVDVQGSKGTSDSYSCQLLTIADGANSDKKGALGLIGIAKQDFAQPVDILACQFEPVNSPGELIIRNTPGDQYAHIAAFALPDQLVLYCKSPPGAEVDRPDVLEELAEEALGRLNEKSKLLSTPQFVRQRARQATSFSYGNTIVVIGDAAFSGTAVLGVYLNKGICDARAIGELCYRARREPSQISRHVGFFSSRAQSLAYRQAVLEEQAISTVYNTDLRSLRQTPLSKSLYSLGPRWAFRYKVNNTGMLRATGANLADTYSTIAGSIGEWSENYNAPLATLGFKTASKFWRRIQQRLE